MCLPLLKIAFVVHRLCTYIGERVKTAGPVFALQCVTAVQKVLSCSLKRPYTYAEGIILYTVIHLSPLHNLFRKKKWQACSIAPTSRYKQRCDIIDGDWSKTQHWLEMRWRCETERILPLSAGEIDRGYDGLVELTKQIRKVQLFCLLTLNLS